MVKAPGPRSPCLPLDERPVTEAVLDPPRHAAADLDTRTCDGAPVLSQPFDKEDEALFVGLLPVEAL